MTVIKAALERVENTPTSALGPIGIFHEETDLPEMKARTAITEARHMSAQTRASVSHIHVSSSRSIIPSFTWAFSPCPPGGVLARRSSWRVQTESLGEGSTSATREPTFG